MSSMRVIRRHFPPSRMPAGHSRRATGRFPPGQQHPQPVLRRLTDHRGLVRGELQVRALLVHPCRLLGDRVTATSHLRGLLRRAGHGGGRGRTRAWLSTSSSRACRSAACARLRSLTRARNFASTSSGVRGSGIYAAPFHAGDGQPRRVARLPRHRDVPAASRRSRPGSPSSSRTSLSSPGLAGRDAPAVRRAAQPADHRRRALLLLLARPISQRSARRTRPTAAASSGSVISARSCILARLAAEAEELAPRSQQAIAACPSAAAPRRPCGRAPTRAGPRPRRRCERSNGSS